jgi:AraC family transcriptional regulator of adaptative response/methylated-DNA-[protein]-cysteine methyltransferase
MTTAETRMDRARDYERIRVALDWVAAHYTEQPSLERIAAELDLSEFHFQRLFSRWVGLSPKRYVQHLTLARAKARLEESASVLEAAYDAGLSGPGRLHDLFVRLESMTPGEFRRRGAGLEIGYGFQPSPFGECLLMVTDRGVCGLAFTDPQTRGEALESLGRGWANARLVEAPRRTAELGARIFAPTGREAPIDVLVRGTPFQVKVWEALLRIPAGALTSYENLARRIGTPHAVRAVAGANAANAVSYLIPCHRVIRKSGALGGYRWGLERKLALLSAEAAIGAMD